MSDFESWAPGEGEGGGLEELSEEAKQRFAAAGKAMKQQKRDEKRAKKKDDQLARTIIQFLNDDQQQRFFILISKLVARNCPSVFILAVLSLINEDCLKQVQEFFSEKEQKDAHQMVDESVALTKNDKLDAGMNRDLIDWITRLQMVLSHDPERILHALMLDHEHLDGSILQLTTFVLQEFFETQKKDLPFEKAQPLTASILQSVFEPFLGAAKKKALEEAPNEEDE